MDRLCELVQQALGRYDFLNQRLTALETSDGARQISGTERPEPTAEIRVFAFEELLMTSRVYRNASRDGSDCFSIMSSAGRTASWSMLSGLSLSEISHIAILAIPIYAGDISNNEWYEFEPPAVGPTPNVGTAPPGVEQSLTIFGAALLDGLRHAANELNHLFGTDDGSSTYGYIPPAVAKPGAFLKQAGVLT